MSLAYIRYLIKVKLNFEQIVNGSTSKHFLVALLHITIIKDRNGCMESNLQRFPFLYSGLLKRLGSKIIIVKDTMPEKNLEKKPSLYKPKPRLNNFTPNLSVASTILQLWKNFKTVYPYHANVRISFLNYDSLYLLRKGNRSKVL